jgi:preprotein translocase subunit SecF
VVHLSTLNAGYLLIWVVALAALVMWGQTFRTRHRHLMRHKAIMFSISGLFLLVAIGSLATKGLNYGLDFTGGTIMEIAAYKQVNVDEVQAVLADFKTPPLGDKVVQVGADMVPDTDGKLYQRVVVRVTRADSMVNGTDVGKQLQNDEPKALYDALAAKLGEVKQLRIASIGPTISKELKSTALTAVVAALLVQLFYIFLRFGNQLRFGLAADLSIIHDVVIMVGLYSLAGRQLDSPFVAALLTVAGYSVMDSVVIFDRIRENIALNAETEQQKPFEEVVNESVNQTMTRSINTTMTVIITLLAIYFFGGETLQNFAFALLIGITSGAYSSICVASPLLCIIDKWSATYQSNRPARAARAYDPDEIDPVEAAMARQSLAGGAPRRRRRGPRGPEVLPQVEELPSGVNPPGL